MSNYNNLKTAIQQVIKQNGKQEITGDILQSTLLAMVNSIGENYQYVGIATPELDPGSPDQNVMYITSQNGVYANFNNLQVENEIAVLTFNGEWAKQTIYSLETINDVRSRASQTYENLAAIEASGESNPNKIYIDGETMQPYIYKDGKFVPSKGGDGSNKILDWNTDVATTRKKIQLSDRKSGLQISYNSPDYGWVNEQYIGTSFTDTEWVKDINWKYINQTPNIATGLYENVSLSDDILDWEQGMLSIEGTLTPGYDAYTSDFISVVPGANIIEFVGRGSYGGSYWPVILGYSKNKEVVRTLLELGNSDISVPVTTNYVEIPSDVYYVRLCCRIPAYDTAQNTFRKISIDERAKLYINEKLLTPNNLISQGASPSNTGGNFISRTNTVDYFPIIEGMTIYTNARGTQSAGGVVLYDSGKSFIENMPLFYDNEIDIEQAYTFTKEDIERGVAYLRAGFFGVSNPSFYVKYQNEPLDLRYIPYLIAKHGLANIGERRVKSTLIQHNYNTATLQEDGKTIISTANNQYFHIRDDDYTNKSLNSAINGGLIFAKFKLISIQAEGVDEVKLSVYLGHPFGSAKVGEEVTVFLYSGNESVISGYYIPSGNGYITISNPSTWELVKWIFIPISNQILKELFSINPLPGSIGTYDAGYLFQYDNFIDKLFDTNKPYQVSNLSLKSERSRKRLLSTFYTGKTYTSFGDSITQGTGGGYVSLIADYFSMNLNNLGVGGSRPHGTDPTTGNPGNLRDEQLAKITEDTMLVTISGGHNTWKTSDDINSLDRSNSIGAFNYAIDYIREHFPMAVILLCPTRTNQTMYDDYRKIGENKQVPVIPTDDETLIGWERDKTLKLLRYDNVHFTRFGNVRFAALCISEIEKLIF